MIMDMPTWRWHGHVQACLAILTISVRFVVHAVDHPTERTFSSTHPADLQPNEAPSSHLAGPQDEGTGRCSFVAVETPLPKPSTATNSTEPPSGPA